MEGLAWPAAAVVLGLAGMLIFRRPLLDFFARTTNIALWGARAAAAAPQAAAQKPDGAHEIMKAFDNALLVADENGINDDLKQRGLAGRVEAIPVLVRVFASARIQLYFEKIFADIWGSQLAILQHLNTLKDAGAPMESLKPFYEQAAATYPPMFQRYPFQQYMGFLAGRGLIEIKGNTAAINLRGREFLKWIIDEGRGFRPY